MIFRTHKAFQRLEDRCRALEHSVEDLERGHKKLGLEWEELYDKVRRMMSRISKRVAVDAKESEQIGGELPVDTGASSVDSISARIQRRRAGYGAQQ